MKTLQLIFLIALSTVFFGCGGSSDQNTGNQLKNKNQTVADKYLNQRDVNTSEELEQCHYKLYPNSKGYITFTLENDAIIGYVLHNGVLQIFDSEGITVETDIFMPVENNFKSLTLASGSYTLRVQNPMQDSESDFLVYSSELDLKCIRYSENTNMIVSPLTDTFVVIDTSSKSSIKVTVGNGIVELYSSDLTLIASGKETISVTELNDNEYLLFVRNNEEIYPRSLNITIE